MHEHDPWHYVGFHQRELERSTKLLMNIMCEIRRLKEAGILSPDEFILFRSRLKERLHRLEAVSDLVTSTDSSSRQTARYLSSTAVGMTLQI